MSNIYEENPVATLGHYASAASSSVTAKVYSTPNPSKGKRYNNLDDLLNELCSPEQLAEVDALVASQSVGTELTAMRIRSGISQKMMAAALGVSQPRISAIETAPNARISLQSIQKYVEVTRLPFKATLEDGSVLSVSLPSALKRRPRRKKAEACA